MQQLALAGFIIKSRRLHQILAAPCCGRAHRALPENKSAQVSAKRDRCFCARCGRRLSQVCFAFKAGAPVPKKKALTFRCWAFLCKHRKERPLEDIIGDYPPLSDAFCFVERPVDAEINAALTVFFLRLRK